MTLRRLLALLLFAVFAAAQDVRSLTILHSNDLHAHLLPDDRGMGGFAYLATAVREERARSAASLYLNAGDLVQGTPVSTLFKGLPIYQIANRLGFDVSTLGNHEFDYGWQRIQDFVKTAKYPIVSANVANDQGTLLAGKPYVIMTAGGIRVAVIGVLLGDLAGNLATPEKVGPWRVLPVVDTVRKYAAELHDKSDLIVVLGHIHDAEADEILQQVPDVSVAIVGHAHKAYAKLHNFDGRVGALVTSYGVELGRLDLQVDMAAHKLKSAEWKIVPVDSKKLRPDPRVAREVAHWEAKVSKLVDVPIGESKRRLEKKDLQALVERAMCEQTGSDLAWVNLGNIRDVVPAGTVLARAIWNILPFDNAVVIGKFKGSQLPPKVREGHSIDPDREYTLAVTDFTAANQASNDQLGVSGLEFPKTDAMQRDLVIEWIRKKKVLE
ncbi:MAG TPA: bifunctional UDP-sugar hydrolase/5'-nucleotidase [Bryobacteraceae bacterium]|jgi:2',3'-cyclic-nucleotide 2'-phosphodiesterase (5'-nucleotidase family)|nr:bifunctional UDP-sugar hydrolase/5'-nucleotidase [Bryobacteraceae bacterium]